MTCTDVFVLPQTCDRVFIYPSQVHPHGGGGRPSGPLVRRGKGKPIPRHPYDRMIDDEDVLIALALLDLL